MIPKISPVNLNFKGTVKIGKNEKERDEIAETIEKYVEPESRGHYIVELLKAKAMLECFTPKDTEFTFHVKGADDVTYSTFNSEKTNPRVRNRFIKTIVEDNKTGKNAGSNAVPIIHGYEKKDSFYINQQAKERMKDMVGRIISDYDNGLLDSLGLTIPYETPDKQTIIDVIS